MIVSYREADLTLRTVMRAEDPDELLDLFEAIVYAMFKDFDHKEVFKRIERAAKSAAKDHD